MGKISEILVDNIRRLRDTRGWTQSQAAERCSIPFPTYREFEYGTRFPRQEQIEKLAHGFGVDESVLFSDGLENPGYFSKIPKETLKPFEACSQDEITALSEVVRVFGRKTTALPPKIKEIVDGLMKLSDYDQGQILKEVGFRLKAAETIPARVEKRKPGKAV